MKYQVSEKCTRAVLHMYIEKISNVSMYEFTSIAVYKFTSIAVYKLVGLYSLSANLSCRVSSGFKRGFLWFYRNPSRSATESGFQG